MFAPLQLDQFDYQLHPELIAHQPLSKRDHSRLMVVDRQALSINEKNFYDLPNLLRPGDVLVRNNTKVIPARLIGHKPTGGRVEILLTKPKDSDWIEWECLAKPWPKNPTMFKFAHSHLTAHFDQGKIIFSGVNLIRDELLKIGQTPLPPYLHSPLAPQKQQQVYQTTFAKKYGSVAAPTAGLHFTPELDKQLEAKGVEILEIELHVGLGTFLPVKTADITQHKMHSEWFCLSKTTAAKLNQAKRASRRIIAVGTTSLRVLESCADESGHITAQSGETNIFIYPPYHLKTVSGLITNFHLPKTTLLMLVSAFVSFPNTKQKFTEFRTCLIGQAYSLAITNHYRFFSFGDSMLIT